MNNTLGSWLIQFNAHNTICDRGGNLIGQQQHVCCQRLHWTYFSSKPKHLKTNEQRHNDYALSQIKAIHTNTWLLNVIIKWHLANLFSELMWQNNCFSFSMSCPDMKYWVNSYFLPVAECCGFLFLKVLTSRDLFVSQEHRLFDHVYYGSAEFSKTAPTSLISCGWFYVICHDPLLISVLLHRAKYCILIQFHAAHSVIWSHASKSYHTGT